MTPHPDALYFAAMQIGIPSLGAPDPLADTERTDGIMVMHHNNEGMEDVRDSALRAEELGEFRRVDYRGEK